MTITKRNFQSPKKSHFFSKGLTHAFGQKMPFFLYLDLIKMRLKIMLSDFAGKKGTFFGIKKRIFQSPKNCTFPKALTRAFGQKMPFFLYLNLIKISLE